jgi:phage-related minor tail protein
MNDDPATLTADLRTLAAESRTAFAAVAEGARSSRAALRDTSDATRALSGAFKSALGGAFRAAAQDGAKLSDVLKGVALDLSRSLANRAIGGLSSQLGTALGQGVASILPFAKGGVIDSGSVRKFAQGGIVSGPTAFPLKGGTGLMGEAGPEAIMPLRRGADGRLGVAAASGGSTVNITINTPDAESFQRSRTQIAATLARAVDRGRRNL